MKKHFIITFFSIAVAVSFAQAPTFQWAKKMDGAVSIAKAYSTVADLYGNVFTVGNFTGTVDFDPGAGLFNMTSASMYDVFITKMSPLGNFIWAKRIGGIGSDFGNSVAVDASGNVYAAGMFQDSVDFDPNAGVHTLSSAGSGDAFVLKLDANGNLVFAVKMGGSFNDAGNSMVLDGSGNIYLAGVFQGNSDFDPGPGTFTMTSSGSNDIFVSKLNPSGNFVWSKKLGGTGYDVVNSIALDSFGNLHTTGYYDGTADFDPGPAIYNLVSTGYFEVFISKLTNRGDFVWAKSIGGPGNDIGKSVKIDKSGSVYSTGYFGASADFDPGPATSSITSSGSDDIYISKLDSSGNFLWAKSVGGTNTDNGNSIDVDASGNAYVTGFFQGSVSFGSGAGSLSAASRALSYDIFISKLDTSGNFIWTQIMGGIGDDISNSIHLDLSGNIYTSGNFLDTVDFDPGIFSYSLTSVAIAGDAFVHKMSQGNPTVTLVSQNLSDNGFKIFPNPADSYVELDLSEFKSFEKTVVQIFDFSGKLIVEEEKPTAKTKFNTALLSDGLYFLMLSQDALRKQAKLLVRHTD